MNETEHKLLEMAAKAVGHTLIWSDDGDYAWLDRPWDGQPNCDDPWNPLIDDGDAFRLAVKLNMSVGISEYDRAIYVHAGPLPRVLTYEPWGENKDDATRRAIVRAATNSQGIGFCYTTLPHEKDVQYGTNVN